MPPPVPVIVTVRVPVVAREVAVNLRVDVPVPGAPIDAGVNVAVTPEGKLLTDKLMAALKPFSAAVLMVVVLELLRTTVTAVGEALMEKSTVGAAVTVSVSGVD